MSEPRMSLSPLSEREKRELVPRVLAKCKSDQQLKQLMEKAGGFVVGHWVVPPSVQAFVENTQARVSANCLGIDDVNCACGRLRIRLDDRFNGDPVCDDCCGAFLARPHDHCVLLRDTNDQRTLDDIKLLYFRKSSATLLSSFVMTLHVAESAADVLVAMAFLSLQVYNILAPGESNCQEQIHQSLIALNRHLGSDQTSLFNSVIETRMLLGTFGHPVNDNASTQAEKLHRLLTNKDDLLSRFDQCLHASLFCHSWVLFSLQVGVSQSASCVPALGFVPVWHRFDRAFYSEWSKAYDAFVRLPSLRAKTLLDTAAMGLDPANFNRSAAERLLRIANRCMQDSIMARSSWVDRYVCGTVGQLAFHYAKTYLRAAAVAMDDNDKVYSIAISYHVLRVRHGAPLRCALRVGQVGALTTVSVDARCDMFAADINVDFNDKNEPVFGKRGSPVSRSENVKLSRDNTAAVISRAFDAVINNKSDSRS